MDRTHFSYLDFELEIGPGLGREYPVAVVHSPAGEAHETMRFPYDELALENRLDKLQIALLRSSGKRRQILAPEEQAVHDFGRELFDALLTREVRSRYDVSQEKAIAQGKGLRLRLRIQPPELAALPWEFLYDSRQAEYVCLSRNTPVVRYLELPQPVRPLTVTRPLRILGLVANPSDLPPLDVAREKERVERAIQDLRAHGLVSLQWLEGQTWRDLQRAMRSGTWHVFHFIGHGGFDRNTDEGFLALADEEGETLHLSATQLGRLLVDNNSLRLVLLNACEGARGSQCDIFSSTASILVRRGIPAVVAMQYEITDRAAIEFARAFYDAMADGMPVDGAVVEARKAISFAVANTVEWGTPVLFSRSSDGILFDISKSETQLPELEYPASRVRKKQDDEARSKLRSLPLLILFGVLGLVLMVGIVAAWLSNAVEKSTRMPTDAISVAAAQLTLTQTSSPNTAPSTPSLFIGTPTPQLPPSTPTLSVPPTKVPTATAVLVVGTTTVREKDRMVMVSVPGGKFIMGSGQGDPMSGENEKPLHEVTLGAFWIDKYEVTNAQYVRCVTDGKCGRSSYADDATFNGDNYPVVGVSWEDAAAYCQWVGGRLPTEAEWEYAARGPQGLVYPWGNQFECPRGNFDDELTMDDYLKQPAYTVPGGVGCDGYERTAPVGSFPGGASWCGALDMSGNVWEWVTDWYDSNYYAVSPPQNPTGPDTGISKVMRGGSWFYGTIGARTAFRRNRAPGDRDYAYGFRCALDAGG